MPIILLTGRNAAGKTEAGKYLEEDYGYPHKEVSAYLAQRAQEARVPIGDRPALHRFANELREKYGPAAAVEALYREIPEEENATIGSIRVPGEIYALRKLAGERIIVFAFDANRQKRYDRTQARKRKDDINLSFDEFCRQEDAEMESGDENHQSLSKCMELADYQFTNDRGISELRTDIDWAMTNIAKRGF